MPTLYNNKEKNQMEWSFFCQRLWNFNEKSHEKSNSTCLLFLNEIKKVS